MSVFMCKHVITILDDRENHQECVAFYIQQSFFFVCNYKIIFFFCSLFLTVCCFCVCTHKIVAIAHTAGIIIETA